MAQIQSFDRTENIEGPLFRPDRYRQLFSLLTRPGAISRGAGLSYCNAGASRVGGAILSTEFNRFLAFDPVRCVVRVEGGVTLGDLLNFAVAHDLVPPVLAGHPRITVGGAIAMNIHGKNQFRTGNFGNHVKSLVLFHPGHGELECSPDNNAEIFRLTVGGFGLTGHIVSADIALQALPDKGMVMERHAVGDLAEAAQTMDALADDADHLYSWHDFNRAGTAFGQGTVYLERHAAEPTQGLQGAPIMAATIKPLPWALLSRLSIPVMCRLYGWKENAAPRRQNLSLNEALFPIVGKEMYFRLFGRRGFREYQALFPKQAWGEIVRQISTAIKQAAVPISLASLKLFRGERRLLNFAGTGVCLALNAPNTAGTLDLFNRLDRITIDSGGIANIAKDSRLGAEAVRAMYGESYCQFRDALHAFDPACHFQSELRRRLDV